MRLKIVSAVFLFMACAVSAVLAEESTRPVSDESAVLFKQSAPAPAARTLFVVETDEQSGVESLNRISGEIDKGFIYSDDDASYKSSNQATGPSPFTRQDQEERA